MTSVVAAVVPIVVAASRAIGRGWIPIGDNAFLTLRSLDVFNQHIPLLGTWSSSSQSYGINLNNPGPLLFDALAVPAKVLGSPVGIPVAVAALNCAAVVGIAVFAYRRGGVLLGTVAGAVGATLAWTMGSEVLYEPWQPHSLMLPFLLMLFVSWSAVCGDLVAVPIAAGLGSFILETHLTYAVLVPVLGGWAIVGAGVWLAGERRRVPDAWPALRRRAGRVAAVTAAVLAVAWAQPLIEEFTSSGPGNLTRLARATRASHVSKVGLHLGTRLVAAVVALPPLWFRPSLTDTFSSTGWQPPALGLALGSLAILVAVLIGCAWDARRRSDRASLLAVVTGGIVLVTAVVTAAQAPVTGFGPYSPHGLRWLWPVAAFLFFAVAASVVRHVATARPPSARILVGGFTLVAVVISALNLPSANLGGGSNSQQYAIPAVKNLDPKLGVLEHHGPLLVDDMFTGVVFSPYGAAVLVEMQRRGIPFVARDPGLVRQLGPNRQYTGHNATTALLLRMGTATLSAPPNSRSVATAEGLSATDEHTRVTLERQITGYLLQVGLALNRRGELAVQRGALPPLASTSAGGFDPQALILSGALVTLITQHDLALNPTWAPRFARFAQLEQAWERQTVALYLAPIRPSSTAPTFQSR